MLHWAPSAQVVRTVAGANCYGSILAWHVYGGHTTVDNVELVRLLYRHHFSIFIKFDFELASIADIWQYIKHCNSECYEEHLAAAVSYIGNLGELFEFEPLYFYGGISGRHGDELLVEPCETSRSIHQCCPYVFLHARGPSCQNS